MPKRLELPSSYPTALHSLPLSHLITSLTNLLHFPVFKIVQRKAPTTTSKSLNHAPPARRSSPSSSFFSLLLPNLSPPTTTSSAATPHLIRCPHILPLLPHYLVALPVVLHMSQCRRCCICCNVRGKHTPILSFVITFPIAVGPS
jgi:hypothetical protein